MSAPDAILLRSHKLSAGDIPESVSAIARAGAGVNNIPVDHCTEQGIVVFNTLGQRQRRQRACCRGCSSHRATLLGG